MAKQKTKAPKPPQPAPPAVMSDEAVLADIDLRHTWAKTVRYVLTVAALGIPLLCAYPITAALAGETTVLNVSIGITITVAVTLAGVAALIRGNHYRKRATRAEDRNKQLSRDVRELQERLRENGLPDGVTRS